MEIVLPATELASLLMRLGVLVDDETVERIVDELLAMSFYLDSQEATIFQTRVTHEGEIQLDLSLAASQLFASFPPYQAALRANEPAAVSMSGNTTYVNPVPFGAANPVLASVSSASSSLPAFAFDPAIASSPPLVVQIGDDPSMFSAEGLTLQQVQEIKERVRAYAKQLGDQYRVLSKE